MSDTNRVALRAVKEVTYGIVPSTPALEELCITGAPNLAFAPETTVSEKIRADRQVDDLVLVGGEAAGDVPSELAFNVHDLLLGGAFFSTFQQRVRRTNDEVNTQITATVATAFTVTDEGDTVIVDDILRAEGFTTGVNNGFHIVDGAPTNTSFTVATTLTVETPPLGAKLRVVGRRSAAGDIDALTGPNSVSSVILDFTTLGLAVGDWIKFTGFGVAVNNDFARISVIAANLLTFDIVPTGWAADAPAGAVDIFLGERLTNGVLFQSYSLEEEFQDHTPVTFQYFRGMVVDGMSLSAQPQAIVTLGFTFSGKDAFFSDATTPATVPDQLPAVDGAGRVTGATTVTLGTVDVLNSSSNVARISRGGVPITGANFVLEATVEIANNLRQLNAVGFLGSIDIGTGTFDVTGTLNTYFDNADLARDVISNAETSFDIRFEDDTSHAIVIDAPRIKFSEGAPEVPGRNDDVTINLGYQAIRDATKGYTLLWQRFAGIQ